MNYENHTTPKKSSDGNFVIRYSMRKASPETARLSIRSSDFLDPERKPEVWRFFLDQANVANMHRGACLGKEAGKPCALIVMVRRNDVICTRENIVGAIEPRWNYYRIGNHFELIPMELPNRCHSRKEIGVILTNHDLREPYEMEVSDFDLEKFFSQRHPHWLQEIARRQIFHWEQNKPKKFFRFAFIPFAPSEAAGEDIGRCVTKAPCAALARFQDRLSAKQLAHCLSRAPAAAVIYAFEKIPVEKRRTFLLDHAKEALLHSATRLSDEELGFCASLDMFTAFRCRTKMEPERRALLLAHSYLIIQFGNNGASLTSLQSEIRASIMEFPAQWRASDPAGFSSILEGLSKCVGLSLDTETMTNLLQKTEGADRLEIAQLIASKI